MSDPVAVIFTQREALILKQWLIGDDDVRPRNLADLAAFHKVQPKRMGEILRKIGRKAARAYSRSVAEDEVDEFPQEFIAVPDTY